ncbi:hypothetical protein T03_16997, partial [Trichinella britovi]
MFKFCVFIIEYVCSITGAEIYPFVSNMKMFKSCCLIVDYICIMAGGMIFTLFQ